MRTDPEQPLVLLMGQCIADLRSVCLALKGQGAQVPPPGQTQNGLRNMTMSNAELVHPERNGLTKESIQEIAANPQARVVLAFDSSDQRSALLGRFGRLEKLHAALLAAGVTPERIAIVGTGEYRDAPFQNDGAGALTDEFAEDRLGQNQVAALQGFGYVAGDHAKRFIVWGNEATPAQQKKLNAWIGQAQPQHQHGSAAASNSNPLQRVHAPLGAGAYAAQQWQQQHGAAAADVIRNIYVGQGGELRGKRKAAFDDPRRTEETVFKMLLDRAIKHNLVFKSGGDEGAATRRTIAHFLRQDDEFGRALLGLIKGNTRYKQLIEDRKGSRVIQAAYHVALGFERQHQQHQLQQQQQQQSPTTQLDTSNIVKYKVGQYVQGLAEGTVSGLVIGAYPKTSGATSGPGKITIASARKFDTSNIAKYTVGQYVERLGGFVIDAYPKTSGATSGPGKITIASARKLDTSNIAKYTVGQYVERLGGFVIGAYPKTSGATSGPGQIIIGDAAAAAAAAAPASQQQQNVGGDGGGDGHDDEPVTMVTLPDNQQKAIQFAEDLQSHGKEFLADAFRQEGGVRHKQDHVLIKTFPGDPVCDVYGTQDAKVLADVIYATPGAKVLADVIYAITNNKLTPELAHKIAEEVGKFSSDALSVFSKLQSDDGANLMEKLISLRAAQQQEQQEVCLDSAYEDLPEFNNIIHLMVQNQGSSGFSVPGLDPHIYTKSTLDSSKNELVKLGTVYIPVFIAGGETYCVLGSTEGKARGREAMVHNFAQEPRFDPVTGAPLNDAAMDIAEQRSKQEQQQHQEAALAASGYLGPDSPDSEEAEAAAEKAFLDKLAERELLAGENMRLNIRAMSEVAETAKKPPTAHVDDSGAGAAALTEHGAATQGGRNKERRVKRLQWDATPISGTLKSDPRPNPGGGGRTT